MDTTVLKKLIELPGVSGSEAAVRSFVIEQIKSSVDDVVVDGFGNLICRKQGPAPKVMLVAHLDEVGLMTKAITDEGEITFSTIGFIDPLSLIGQRVIIQTNKEALPGVITTKQLSAGQEQKQLPTINELFIDTGYTKQELERKEITTGMHASLEISSAILTGETIMGKALDDRIGVFILIEFAKLLKEAKNEIFIVFSVQEEMGLYAATTSAFTINPDWAIAIDVVDDTAHDEHSTVKLGNGAVITAKDAGMIGNKYLNAVLIELAKKNKIPLQIEVSDEGTNDALAVSTVRSGVPATAFGVPIRNMHSTFSIARLKDIENAIKLLLLLFEDPPKVCLV